MDKYKEAYAALAVAAVGASADFASGREIAAFYAQLAGASWLAAALSGLIFGLITAMFAQMARQSGAGDMYALFRKMPGGMLGRLAHVLYAGMLLVAGWTLVAEAARLGALALPLNRAPLFGAAFALLAAAWLALDSGSLKAVSAAFVGLLLLFELALLLFARLDVLPGMLFVIELKLSGSRPAAVLLALIHSTMCACLCAGLTVRMAGEGARPARLGIWSGAVFLALVIAGNAALRNQMDELLALEVPFAALASNWGIGGFWTSATVMYLASVTSLSGLICGLLPRKWMLNSKYSQK